MADPQPVIVSYLKLAPDEQPFFRIKEIFQVPILQKLNHLTLALAASQDSHPSPEVQKILHDLRKIAGDQCTTAARITDNSKQYADNFMTKLLDSLLLPSAEEDSHRIAERVSIQSEVIAERCEGAVQGMEKFIQEVNATVRRISKLLNEDNSITAGLVFTEENLQVVNELVQAAQECKTLFCQIQDYFLEMKAHFGKPEFLRAESPSEEEVDLMRERWNGFSDALAGLSDGWGAIISRIASGPDLYKAKKLGDAWQSQSAGNDDNLAQPDPPTSKRTITDTNDSSTAPPEETSLPKPTWSSWLWVKLKRLISCLTLRRFR